MTTKCASHPANEATLLCETCKRKICLECSNHEKHTQIPMKEVKKVLEDLTSEQYSVINAIKSLERKAKTSVDSVIQEVQKTGQEMVQKIADVRQNEAATARLMDGILKGQRDSIEEKYLKAKDLKSSRSQYTRCKRLEFIQSHYHMGIIPKAIGRLEWVTEDQELAELCSFKTSKSSFIRSIWPVDSSKAWILHYRDEALHLIDYNGQILETRNFGERVEDFCLSPAGDILYTTWDGCELKKLTKDRESVSLHAFDSAYTTRGICFTGEDVIVCLCSKNKSKPTRLAKMSIAKSTAKELECTAKIGFFEPGRVSCTLGGVMAVIDWKDTGRFVKVIDRDGNTRSTWNGEMKSESNISPFVPFDVSFCNINNDKRFLVTLTGSGWNKVCSVDVSGGNAKCIYTAEEKTCDGAIATDPDGQIWIGDEKGRIHIMAVLAKT
ncbi:uncharacterized protein LOC110459231 [Mizuhopecten yessoensis]|uniref:uncharacterized protein LOC110459231 n=1 Tax=Mizuhopecten yessoensis TaxID=6573 RepID=UPI000B458EED|nr:uncharacterized protein LOC110459231 [Mizuhopecten yessoensis]